MKLNDAEAARLRALPVRSSFYLPVEFQVAIDPVTARISVMARGLSDSISQGNGAYGTFGLGLVQAAGLGVGK